MTRESEEARELGSGAGLRVDQERCVADSASPAGAMQAPPAWNTPEPLNEQQAGDVAAHLRALRRGRAADMLMSRLGFRRIVLRTGLRE